MEILFNPILDQFEVHGPNGIEYEDADVQKCITYRRITEGRI